MNTKNIWLILIALIIIVVIAGIYLTQKPSQKEQVIKIGAILPLTGELGFVGQWMKEGIQVAMELLREDNFKISYYDSKSTANEAVKIFHKIMATKEADILISALTPVSMPLVNLSETNKVPLFISLVSYPNVAQGKQYIFRYHFSGDAEANALAEFIFNNSLWKTKPKIVAILNENNDYGVSVAKVLEESIVNRGGRIVGRIAYDPSERNLREIALKTKQANPQFVYVIGTGKTLGFLLRELLTLSQEWIILSTNAVTVPSVLEVLQGYNYVIYCTMPEFIKVVSGSNSKNEITTQFIQLYNKKFHKNPSFIAAEAFDIINIISRLSRSKKIHFTQSDLYNQEFYLSMGRVSFQQNGDFVIPIFVGTIRNGKFEF